MENNQDQHWSEMGYTIAEFLPENLKGYRIYFDSGGLFKFTLGSSIQSVEKAYIDVTPPEEDFPKMRELILDQLETISFDLTSSEVTAVGSPMLEAACMMLVEYWDGHNCDPGKKIFSFSAVCGLAKFAVSPLFKETVTESVNIG